MSLDLLLLLLPLPSVFLQPPAPLNVSVSPSETTLSQGSLLGEGWGRMVGMAAFHLHPPHVVGR